MSSYVDPFQGLNDIKRQEREALLNNNPVNNNPTTSSKTTASLISRRDYFAAAALQGMLATGSADMEKTVLFAIRYADMLIETLDLRAKYD